MDKTAALLSIGDLARETGISPDTLRAWERRYGRPEPLRLPSGHRRYPAKMLPWLRSVAEALARGHRPGKVLRASEEQLEELLADAATHAEPRAEMLRMLADIASDPTRPLAPPLEAEWEALGPRRFLRETVAPLLEEVGRRWADGRLRVYHEHLVVRAVDDLLRAQRLRMKREGAPRLLLATLEGERHGLGLEMVAMSCALLEQTPLVVGVDTPMDEIVAAAMRSRAPAVGISVSLATGGIETDRRLKELRAALPRPTRLLVGGAGARGVRRGPAGIEYAATLDAFESWMKG